MLWDVQLKCVASGHLKIGMQDAHLRVLEEVLLVQSKIETSTSIFSRSPQHLTWPLKAQDIKGFIIYPYLISSKVPLYNAEIMEVPHPPAKY